MGLSHLNARQCHTLKSMCFYLLRGLFVPVLFCIFLEQWSDAQLLLVTFLLYVKELNIASPSSENSDDSIFTADSSDHSFRPVYLIITAVRT
jgi:hypothetical protein